MGSIGLSGDVVGAFKGETSTPSSLDELIAVRRVLKDKLILLLLSDHDPDGVQLAISFARSMRDDFGITKLLPIRVALTSEQIEKHALPSSLDAKVTSPNYKKFVAKHGTRAVELDVKVT